MMRQKKKQKTVNTKTGKQKLNRKPLLLLLLFLHLLCTIYEKILARNFELKDRKKNSEAQIITKVFSLPPRLNTAT